MDLSHSMEVLFPEYYQSISRISSYHGQHFHTMELDKTMEIGFFNLFFNSTQFNSVQFSNLSRSTNCWALHLLSFILPIVVLIVEFVFKGHLATGDSLLVTLWTDNRESLTVIVMVNLGKQRKEGMYTWIKQFLWVWVSVAVSLLYIIFVIRERGISIV